MKTGQRVKGEGQKPFEAFKIYRDLGEERSLAKVATQLGKSNTIIERWSSKWNWVKRVQEYDDELDREKVKEQIKEVKKMAERHAKTSLMFQQKLIERLQQIKPGELNAGDLSRWFEIAVRIERLSRGEPTENINSESNVKLTNPYSELTTEELKKLAKLSDE